MNATVLDNYNWKVLKRPFFQLYNFKEDLIANLEVGQKQRAGKKRQEDIISL